jgi:NAD(P)-dependent dehydrogenase (short-subunit alcohol dehydrogenase family)
MKNLGFAAGNTVVVTGGGGGIGRACALLAAEFGLQVGVWDTDLAGAQETARKIADSGGRSVPVQVDVGDATAVERAWQTTTGVVGAAQHLIANAGPPSSSGFALVEGVAACLRCVQVPIESWLREAVDGERSVVLLGSVRGNRYGDGRADSAWYGVAKAAIVGYMRELAVARPGGLRANAVLPDLTVTARTQDYVERIGGIEVSDNPMKRLGTAEEQAAAVIFLLSPSSSYVNGVDLIVDGGAHLVSPTVREAARRAAARTAPTT